uniref:Protein S-acyltransferase n=1 Tax=Kalanchoe fedtschenkoi TaxID=63787 RepID=A0A7N0UGT3_KALFE
MHFGKTMQINLYFPIIWLLINFKWMLVIVLIMLSELCNQEMLIILQYWYNRWYIFEETALCTWTVILYISYLKSSISRAWWIVTIMILLLTTLLMAYVFLVLLLLVHSYIVLTNQTTYELVRRRRIPYLRSIPARAHPFSKGACSNVYIFCCSRGMYFEPLPTPQELEDRLRPYSCVDVLRCRCCC